MYLTHLRIENMKRVEHLELDFTNPDGTPRMWTVLIGENGTAKTTILQAIALAAAGRTWVNDLARPILPSLVPTRRGRGLEVEARFSFSELGRRFGDHVAPNGLPEGVGLVSRVNLDRDYSTLLGSDSYVGAGAGVPRLRTGDLSPLDRARARGSPHWFVAAYGVGRTLPIAGDATNLMRPGVDRLRPFFQPRVGLTSIDFIDVFGSGSSRGRRFVKAINDILIGADIFPREITKIDLRGWAGATRPKESPFRNGFVQRMGQRSVRVPMDGIAHGMQSTLAWVADLVGHVMYEAEAHLQAADLEGVVLLDEIDLYLHPGLQVSLIRALKKTFPRLQFVVTTHSPFAVAALRPDQDEVVRLEVDGTTGYVRRRDMAMGEAHEPDARVMTTTGVLQTYFGVTEIFAAPEGPQLAEYQAIASNPFRTDAEDSRMRELGRLLGRAAVELGYLPVQCRPPGGA